jgi:hypothetical protein
MTCFRTLCVATLLFAASVVGQNAPVKDSSKVQTIRFQQADAMLCSSENIITTTHGRHGEEVDDEVEGNVKCIVRVDLFPDDSKFEIWFNDGTIIKYDKSQLIKQVQSQPKSKK